jgi:hypothetical protein
MLVRNPESTSESSVSVSCVFQIFVVAFREIPDVFDPRSPSPLLAAEGFPGG